MASTVKKAGGRAKAVSSIAEVAAKKQAEGLARRKAKAEALIALIARRKARIVEDFYDIGEALREILREKLYEALGYPSFAKLLAERELVGVTQAKKLIAVVEQVPREQAVKLGAEKAYALVSYAAATPALDSPAQLVAGDARVGEKKVSMASRRDIESAARAARAKKRAARPATPEERDRERARGATERAVRAALRAGGIARAEVEVREDVVVVTLGRAAANRLAE